MNTERLIFTPEEVKDGVIAVLCWNGYEKYRPAGKGKYPYDCIAKDENPNAMIYKSDSAWFALEYFPMRESFKRHYVPYYLTIYKALPPTPPAAQPAATPKPRRKSRAAKAAPQSSREGQAES